MERRLIELRALPWRSTRDPWAILLSEVMSTQTQIQRVEAPWRRFLERWPDPGSLAEAPLADVLREWEGLGYPRRARYLHLAARRIVEFHDGRVPDALDDLLALPGVGPYTARAVLAFAFERDVGVVDTNVARVLARTTGRSLRPAEAQQLADERVPPGDGWRHNQSMIDVGALHCRPAPRCDGCPLASECDWHRRGHAAPDPAVASAGVSRRQSAFEGSDRQGRGRLMAALGRGPVSRAELAGTMGWPDDAARAERVAGDVVSDGLAVERDGVISLPS